MIAARGALPAALIAVTALMLTGCSSFRAGSSQASAQPEQLQPVQQSTVAQTALPPIGQNGAVQTAGVQTNPMNPGPLTPDPALTGQPGTNIRQDPLSPGSTTMTASNDGSFVSIDAVGAVPNQPGRDLTGGLTVNKLLGGWTVVSGAAQCRLNLTQTAKTGTQRFRASTPGCQVPGLSAVSSWELAGNQVKLFDEQGNIIATLNLSGNRFVGVGVGGIGISMVG